MGAGGCRNLQTARKPGKPAEITGAEQGRDRKSQLRTSQSLLPAKDDVRIVLVGASLCDHPAKALAHLLQTFACVPPQVMGARFIWASLLRLQAFVHERLHVSGCGIIARQARHWLPARRSRSAPSSL